MTEEEKQKIKRMDIKEFRRLGFLQEVNRRFLHPLGLALEVIIDDETGEERLGGVWDYRDDKEGMFFGKDMIKQHSKEFVEELRSSKIEARIQNIYNIDVDEKGVQIN